MVNQKYKEEGIYEVGSIQLKKEVYVTDPCYDVDTWCLKYLDNMCPGEYKCFVVMSDEGNWGMRVKELIIFNKEFLDRCPYGLTGWKDINSGLLDNNYILISEIIGVDSGQCGIFDAEYYEKHQPDDDYDNPNSWYRKICNLTHHSADTIDNLGVVCASGYGDGCYPLYAIHESNSIVALKVIFIGEEDEEELWKD